MQMENIASEDILESMDDFDDEAFDETALLEAFGELDDDLDDDDEAVAEFDDDDDDDEDEGMEEAEFILPALLGYGASKLFRRRRARRYRRFRGVPGRGRGVRGAIIRTPRGTARVRLPRSVVPMSLYKRDMARLTARDNTLVRRINRTQKDLSATDRKAVQALALARAVQKQHRRDLGQMKKEQRSAAMLNMMMNMMQMQGVEDDLRNHRHQAGGGAVDPSTVGNGDSTLTMLLPLMMMDGGKDDNMLPLVLMMSMSK